MLTVTYVLQTARLVLLRPTVNHAALVIIYIMACVRIYVQLDMHPSMVNVNNVQLAAILVLVLPIASNAEVITYLTPIKAAMR